MVDIKPDSNLRSMGNVVPAHWQSGGSGESLGLMALELNESAAMLMNKWQTPYRCFVGCLALSLS
jgi:hypothetical protein